MACHMDMSLLDRCPRIIDGLWYWPVYRGEDVVSFAPESSHPDFDAGAARGWWYGPDYGFGPGVPMILG